ncbi:dihydroorotate dehydrogenase-like protein [Azospirillum sp. TSO22-1]|uniref:dihydroorotate dehydrogenase-like protein n=1 Tax=Azospirillum sp. TSO22-1 TaxID=716789 RepID=UPI000D60D3A2|nr:dihydroorotate dehydrogenase-like protein [Azospirillum sp. TSO22-1]PWC43852.1 dihydroorotate dehydrogenase [Azospirillum sp. TSO22-1]
MDLTTEYLGLKLAHPLMPGASPLVDDLDVVRRLEDAGASAIVMHSLFEEQITRVEMGALEARESTAFLSAEARGFFPPLDRYALGPDAYLGQVARIREAVSVPVIASLNGMTPSGWTRYAGLIEQAGADALELNLYFMATDPDVSGQAVEDRMVELVRMVRAAVEIPLAVKLSPYVTALPALVKRLEAEGVDGLVLFNRFYQPDIDVEALEAAPTLELSRPDELRLRLRWLAALSGRVTPSLAASGGVHTAVDALKAVMAGAHAVQVVSALLRHGPERLAVLRGELTRWLEEHEYESLAQAQGSMNLLRCPDPAAFERGNYQKILQGWKREGW